MNKTCHFFNNSIYLISSHAAARNPIFYNEKLCNRFLSKVDFYLGPIAEILHYTIKNCSFHLLVKLKDRKTFCKHFQRQKGLDVLISQDKIPFSTFIFSKAMNDLLVSTAKYFNYHHQRKGGLFAGRFQRTLIESKVQLEHTMKELNGAQSKDLNCGVWKELPGIYRITKNLRRQSTMKERCARHFYEYPKERHQVLNSFRLANILDRRGCLKDIPPKSIYQHFDRISILCFIPKNTS